MEEKIKKFEKGPAAQYTPRFPPLQSLPDSLSLSHSSPNKLSANLS